MSGTIETYVANTYDLLMSRTVPVMNGFQSIMDNIGQTRNKGVEINLKSVNIQKKDFVWSTNLNFFLNRDEIVELRGDGKDDITNKWFIGKPLQVIYDYNVVGIWQKDESAYNAERMVIIMRKVKKYKKVRNQVLQNLKMWMVMESFLQKIKK